MIVASLATALALALGAPGVVAQGIGGRVTVEVDRPAVAVGDRVTLRVVVEHDTAEAVRWPARPDTLGVFEVLEYGALEPVVEGGVVRETLRVVVTAFQLGQLEVPPIPVVLARADGGETTVATEPVTVSVESVGRDETGDIRDVKPPLEIARWWWFWPAWILAALGLAGLGVLARRRLRRRGAAAPVSAPVAPPRPPHELAHEALDRLDRAGLLERGEIKAFHIEVSEIVRTYLFGRYGIDAMDMTSGDVLRALDRVTEDDAVLEAFAAFFRQSDLVKFAKHRPPPDRCRDMIPAARRLVDATRVPEPRGAAAEAGAADVPSAAGAGG